MNVDHRMNYESAAAKDNHIPGSVVGGFAGGNIGIRQDSGELVPIPKPFYGQTLADSETDGIAAAFLQYAKKIAPQVTLARQAEIASAQAQKQGWKGTPDDILRAQNVIPQIPMTYLLNNRMDTLQSAMDQTLGEDGNIGSLDPTSQRGYASNLPFVPQDRSDLDVRKRALGTATTPQR